jgi:hypothetical protein
MGQTLFEDLDLQLRRDLYLPPYADRAPSPLGSKPHTPILEIVFAQLIEAVEMDPATP